jgi:DNA-binding response OmpR family regulator
LITISEPAPGLPAPNATSPVSSVATIPCVLVVDDEDMVRSLLDMVLRRHGFDVLPAHCGREAIRLFEAHRDRVSCALLDVRMPGLDGPQTLLALRRLEPALPCCFMSGQLGEHSREELLALGVTHFFEKPFHLEEVVSTLHALTCTA